MDNTPSIRKYTDFDEMKADEYRYWQSWPAHERLDAVEEMIETAYAVKGWEIKPDVPRLQRGRDPQSGREPRIANQKKPPELTRSWSMNTPQPVLL